MSKLFSTAIVMVCFSLVGCPSTPRVLQEDSFSRAGILVFGDSGYISSTPGKSALVPVANAMKAFCIENPCDFGVMAGDNIYPRGADGLEKGSKDPARFQNLFLEPYGAMKDYSAEFRLYMALGNHDWLTSRAGAESQLRFAENTRPFYMDGFFYSVIPPAADGLVELFIIDTEMLLSTRKGVSYDIAESGKAVRRDSKLKALGDANAIPQTAEEQAQLSWLAQAMKASKSKWKIVVAHHPLWESKGSKHKQTVVLREFLRPVICQYADLYLAGHQHTLEIHDDNCAETRRAIKNPLLHVISGAAGKSRTVNDKYIAWQKTAYPQMTTKYASGNQWGFMYIAIDKNRVDLRVLSAPKKSKAPGLFIRQAKYRYQLEKFDTGIF